MKLGNFELNCYAICNTVFVLMCVLVLSTQWLVAQQLLWQRMFDTGVEDRGRGVTTDSQNNIIVTGISALQTSSGNCLTIKYDQSGDTIWTRWYDINSNDIVTDSFGNIILAGDMWNDSTNADMRIIKCDPDGNILWTRTYSNGEKDVGEFGYGVAVDSKNNIIITGRTNAKTTLFGAYITLKYDSRGNLLWLRTYDGGWEDYATDVAVDNSDNVIVTGYSNGDMNWDWCTIKYSPDGDLLWIRRHDIALDDKADGVTCDKDGNIIVVGRLGQSPTKYAAIVKYSPAGDTLWTKLFVRPVPLDGLMNFTDVATDVDGNIYTVGLFVLWDNGKVWEDYYIVKCNAQGDTLWTFRYDLNWEDEASGIALDRLGNIIVTGTTNRGLYEENYLTIKIKDTANMIEDNSSLSPKFILYPNYPNPFNSLTTIEFTVPSTLHVVLKIYNLLGQELETLVDEVKAPGMYSIRWNADRYESGVYVVRLTAGSLIETKKMLLLR